jgi:cytochrome c oxidase subunit III
MITIKITGNREDNSVEVTAKEKTSSSPMKLGIILFLISEMFLFGALFTVYYYLRAETAVWPPAGVHLGMGLGVVNTAILLSSSAVIWWAGRAIKKGNEIALSVAFILTIALGMTFLSITGYEWAHESFGVSTSAYGSIFFTMTGFHALHVFGGILLMLSLFARNAKHKFSSSHYLAIEVSSLYWHYVDFIWILVFTTLFIIK